MVTDVLFSLLERGGWVMIPLLACSLTVVWVVIDRLLFWRGRGAAAAGDPQCVLELLRDGNDEEAQVLAAASRQVSARLLAAGLAPDEHGLPLEDRLLHAASDERRRLQGLLGVLEIIVTAAPLLGILGTVLGIIDAFEVMDQQGLADTRGITGGVGRALITTASGLVIALTALFAHHALAARADRALEQLQRWGTALQNVLERRGS